jgi:hypothetical protein
MGAVRQSLWCVCAVIVAGSGLVRETAVQYTAWTGRSVHCVLLLLFDKIPSDILALYKLLKYINQENGVKRRNERSNHFNFRRLYTVHWQRRDRR